MTVSHLTRSRDQLWSDLLVALGGAEAFLSRSISERRILLEIMETFSVTVSTKDIDDLDELLEQVVVAAGGSASHLRQNKHEMLAALVTALGGTPPSATFSSTGELLAACVNAVDTGGGGGGDIPLAIVDFENAVYSVGATIYAVGDVLTGGDFNAGDISPSNGWFPQTDQFPNFGSVLSATLGNVAGLVIVVDAEAVDPLLGSLQVSLQNAASDVVIQFSVETNSGYTLSGPVTTIQNGDGDIPGRAKWGYRVSPSQFAIDATTKVEQDAVPDPSEFDVWTTNSYVEAGNAASWKIYSIKFYEASTDLNSLVVA